MKKIKCSYCKNELDAVCTIKKQGVKITKHRHCSNFIVAPDKIHITNTPPSRYQPFDDRDKTGRRKLRKLAKIETQKKQLEEASSPDCLSNYRSTATEDD